MKFEKEVRFDVDLQELFDDLSGGDQAYFIRENIFGLNLFVLYGISMIMMVVLTYMFHYTNFIW